MAAGMGEMDARKIFEQIDEVCIALSLKSDKPKKILDQFNILHGLDRLRGIVDQLKKMQGIEDADRRIVNELSLKRSSYKIPAPLPTKEEIQKTLEPLKSKITPELSRLINEYGDYVVKYRV